MNRKLFKITILLFIISIQSTISGLNSFKFIISPPIVHLKLHPNSTHKINLTVDNKNEQQLQLMLKTYDLEMDINGNASASCQMEKSSNSFSCAGWLSFSEKKLIIEANSNKIVPITIKVPPGATGGKYGIVLFQTATQCASKGDLLLVGQMGTIFMIEIYGSKKIQGAITEFRFRKENGLINFIATIANQGNIHFQIKGSVVIKDDHDKIVDRVNLAIGTGTILPDHEREFTAIWKNQKKIRIGNCRAILQVHIPGQGGTLQELLDFTI